MNTQTITDRLGALHAAESRVDGDWIDIDGLDPRDMATYMRDNEVRFVTMTTIPRDGGFRLIYHWDVDGRLLNIGTFIAGTTVPSIADILPAADWVERETRDYYAITFAGRTETPPLMLQDTDEPGLFTRTSTVCRDADPADTGWSESSDASEEDAR